MLQILGWLLCLCLFVKGVELASLPEGQGNDGMRFGAGVAVLGAMGFAFWIYSQGNAVSELVSQSSGANAAAMNLDECLNPDVNSAQATISCDKVSQ